MNWELILSIYASVIATIVLGWKIYVFRADRKGNLVISQQIPDYSTDPFHETLGGGVDLEINLVNIGKANRYIENPEIIINKKINDRFTVVDYDDFIYPLLIKPGQKISWIVPIDSLQKKLSNNKLVRLKTTVFDTHGKKFASNWIKLKQK